MKVSLVSLGQQGAGPVYSLEMAKALAENGNCKLQVVISNNITNLSSWNHYFQNNKHVDFHVIEAYKHTKLSVILNQLNIFKQEELVRIILSFKAEVLYIPFGLMWSAYVYSRLHNRMRIITTIHDVKLHDSYHNIVEFGVKLLKIVSNRYVSDHVILNNKDFQFVKENTKKGVVVIPHASFSYYNRSNKFDFSLKKCIGFFGRIEPYKGLDLLVDAFYKINDKNIKLLIAGRGNIEADLLKKINSNPNIQLINRYLYDEEFEELISQVDFLVLPYKRASQSGVIPLSFGFGKTVIATNVGALSEQVPEGTGVLVKPNVDDIAKEILKLYSKPSLIEKFSKGAKSYAETALTWDYSAELLINYLLHSRK